MKDQPAETKMVMKRMHVNVTFTSFVLILVTLLYSLFLIKLSPESDFFFGFINGHGTLSEGICTTAFINQTCRTGELSMSVSETMLNDDGYICAELHLSNISDSTVVVSKQSFFGRLVPSDASDAKAADTFNSANLSSVDFNGIRFKPGQNAIIRLQTDIKPENVPDGYYTNLIYVDECGEKISFLLDMH